MVIIIRLLLLLVAGWLAFLLIRKLMGGPDKTLPPGDKRPEVMLRCAYCDVHLPAGECLHSRGHSFCSEAHRDAYFQDKD